MVVGFTTTCAIGGYQQYFSYMVAVNFIGGGNLSTQRKPPTCRNHWQEEFEDAKGVIRICKSKQNRQHNGQEKKYKRTYKDLQKNTQKTKDRATWTSGSELRCSGRVGCSCSTSDTCRVTRVISYKWGKTCKYLWQVEHIRGHLWHRQTLSHNVVSSKNVSGDMHWLHR